MFVAVQEPKVYIGSAADENWIAGVEGEDVGKQDRGCSP